VSGLLSVVLPTHDRAEDLEGAAASVLDQDGLTLELVVVDDASSDRTPAVLEHLARRDRRVRVVRNDMALGPCEARNRGLEVASGDLVGFCDDDDRWLPGSGRQLVEFLEEYPSVGLVTSWHEVYHAEMQKAVLFKGPLRFGSKGLLWQNFVALPFGILRRAAFSFDIRFDPKLPTGEDWDLWLRCATERPVRTLARPGYRYTQHRRARQTRAENTQVQGRRNFLAKHGPAMPAACRLYHQAVLAGLEEGRAAMTRIVTSSAGYTRRERLFVAVVLGTSLAASRGGQRIGDPGLQSRVMASLVDRPDDR
jgi:glycosyltransferase involved in cell wall biosynthesis